MQTAASADTELVITNVTSIRRVSAGNPTVIHREITEEIQQSSPSEQSGQFRTAVTTRGRTRTC
jgi:hypothetical protein